VKSCFSHFPCRVRFGTERQCRSNDPITKRRRCESDHIGQSSTATTNPARDGGRAKPMWRTLRSGGADQDRGGSGRRRLGRNRVVCPANGFSGIREQTLKLADVIPGSPSWITIRRLETYETDTPSPVIAARKPRVSAAPRPACFARGSTKVFETPRYDGCGRPGLNTRRHGHPLA